MLLLLLLLFYASTADGSPIANDSGGKLDQALVLINLCLF